MSRGGRVARLLAGIIVATVAGSSQGWAAGYTWTGCYLGLEAGWAHSQSDWTYDNNNPYSAQGNAGPQLIAGNDFSQDRAIVGGQAGCNYQMAGPWVVGIEAAVISNPMNRRKDNNNNLGGGATLTLIETVTTDIQGIGSVTGRLGFAPTPDWLIYGKGGYAIARILTAGSVAPAVPGFDWRDSQWHSGWTVGGGVEYRLLRNVTLGAEYNYYQFETKEHSAPVQVFDGPTLSNPVVHSAKADVQTVMGRINFYDPLYFPMGQGASAMAQEGSAPAQFSAFASATTKYYSWNGTRGSNVFAVDPGKGSQVYTPATVGVDYYRQSAVKLETRFKTGYVSAHQSTLNQIASYDGPVDSQVSINATFLQFSNVRPQLGVAANLPTGNAFLPNNQRFARMDPDLVEIGSFGAGYNVNPTAGFIMGLNQNTAMSFSAGYAWQGAFVREAVDLNAGGGFGSFDVVRKIDPGDVFTANGNITTQIGQLVLLGTFAYMSESDAKIDGIPSGRSGARYNANLTATQTIDERWSVVLNGSWSYAEKNKIALPGGVIVPELKNSNSNVIIGSVEPSYMLTERLKVAANYSVLWRDENYYDPFENQFIPAKVKHTAGGSATYAITQTSSIELRGSHSWIHQETGAFLPVTLVPLTLASLPPSLSYKSWMASIGATVRF